MTTSREPGQPTPPPLPADLERYLPGWPPRIRSVARKRSIWMALVAVGGFLGFLLGIVLASVGAITHVNGVEAIGAFLLLAGIVSLVVMAAWARKAREGQVPEVAHLLGLRFSQADPFGLATAGLPFEVFRQRGVEVRNVMWGGVDGVPLQGFDLRYQVHGGPDEGWVPTGWRFMALAPLPANCPPLWVGPASVLHPTEETPRVRFESIAFNQRMCVLGPDAYFATALVDARMMAWMLDEAPAWTTFEVDGRHVLARMDSQDDLGGDMGQVLVGLSRFVRHVPQVVRSLYPLEGRPGPGFQP